MRRIKIAPIGERGAGGECKRAEEEKDGWFHLEGRFSWEMSGLDIPKPKGF